MEADIRNPFEAIEFFPAVGKFGVLSGRHKSPLKRILATFDTLEEAINARQMMKAGGSA